MTKPSNEKIIDGVLGDLGVSEKYQKKKIPNDEFPIAISARHVHLSEEHIEVLFGKGYQLTKKADLSQPNQFASTEKVIIEGPKGSIENVRVLGPARSLTQAEVSWTDALKLGIKPPLRDSGNINGSESFSIIGPKAKIYLKEGLIIAQAHIHMKPQDAKRLNVKNNEHVAVEVEGIRPLIFKKVKVRVSELSRLEMHIDTDEANAGLIEKGAIGRILWLIEEHTNLNTEDEIRKVFSNNKITF